ncbi:MAG: hypothetical protein ACLF0P_18010, partial [Thermoanaerobaculia bacterium]
EWRRLEGVSRLHVALGQAPEAAGAARAGVLRALEVLEPWAAERPDDRRARRWLAEALLLLGDGEVARGDGPAAERSWSRAAETLAPVVAGGTSDHVLLTLRARALERLDRRDEAAEAWAALAAAGVARPVSPAGPRAVRP